MIILLTPLQSFNAMAKFLDDYYKKILSDDLAVLLDDMEFLKDDKTADPAAWNRWIKLIGMESSLTTLQAFNAMHKYVQEYGDRIASQEIVVLLKSMKVPKNDNIVDSVVWKHWMKSVDDALHEPEGSRSYLKLTK